jgi:chemotaxis protein CheX
MKPSPAVELVKVCKWLETAVVEVVETMFGCIAHAEGAPDLAHWQGGYLQSEISFSGGFDLTIRIWMREECATELTSRVLEMPKQELTEQVVGDTLGEMSNMILGAVKSKVVDRGIPCALSMPSVSWGATVTNIGRVPEQERLLFFRFPPGQLLLGVAIPG